MSATINVQGAAARAVTHFGVNLLRELSTASGGKNIVLSPFNILTNLAMLHNGASGHTREAIARVLGLYGLSDEEINAAMASVISDLPSAKTSLQLYLANGLWVDEKVRLSPVYLEKTRAIFHAEMSMMEFGPALIPTVNGWVNRSTHSKITRIIERGETPGDMLLVSAIYFKGLWASAFERRITEPGTFSLPDGTRKTCPMMNHWGRLSYFEDATLQAVRLPYLGDRMSMYVFLPGKAGLGPFIEALTPDKLTGLLAALYTSEMDARSIHLQMPRFRIDFDTGLDEILKKMGMGLAFDTRRAEFGEMCPSCRKVLFVGKIRHRASLEVNEEGTEAAAATQMAVSLGLPIIPDMIVDRPFFVVIRDEPSGAILFAGLIFEP